MAKANEHIVFVQRTVVRRSDGKRITYGCYLNLNELDMQAFKATKNKSRKAKDGPVYVEIHSIQ